MQPPHHYSRINLAELKAQLVKKLGPEGAKQYFYFLHMFLSLKLSKVEFNKLCLRIIGRENIPLHNQLIRSILRNACSAKTPPPANQKDDVLRHGVHLAGKDMPSDSLLQNGSHANIAQASGSPCLSNGGGDMLLPLSPRKVRTNIRDLKAGDRRSALGPNGKASFATQLPAATLSSDFGAVLENGDLNPPDMRSLRKQSGSENEIFAPNAAKMSIVRRSLDVSAPSCSKDQTELVVSDDGKEASARSPLRAPLGVQLCPVSVGGAHRALPLSSSSRCLGSYNNGSLLDSLTLREQMEQIALVQGLEGVSVDSANILNHSLDTYMKGLIRSCIELVRPRSGHESTKNKTNKHPSYMKLINGVKPGHEFLMQHSGKTMEVQEQRSQSPISLQDFRVAMELNPQKLGEDWPMLLEKICTHAFEE
ncbi:hypothetical protein SASPL_125950 [Salvia splendens]|uniref:Transcriptional coactivator Hfi1/Transcriptional adapter 1 n=1 Tax=Salvia splendens TaxID=180675 RepID=A0A8X8XI17_SALSN|nr:uncharacterized protein LOC121748145 [Salvia splendens]XP_041998305.1 uncharacterized protein LOC121748145 [Salvia splendens]KAG6413242.1 hypothetical protein SASPL_125950 [Salvia splendens]